MFFLLDLAEKIEDKRLKSAIAVESFLAGCLSWAKLRCLNLLNNKYSSLYFSIVIVAASVFLRSYRDLSIDAYAGLGIFSAISLVDVVGVACVLLSFVILGRSKFLGGSSIFLNLAVCGICVGYFLRLFALGYNDFVVLDSLFLASFYLIICYCLLGRNAFSQIDHFVFWSCCLFIVAYGICCFDFSYFFENYLEILKFYVYPLIFFWFVVWRFVSKEPVFSRLFLLNVFSLFLLSVFGDNFYEKWISYSVFLPSSLLVFAYLIEKKKIDFNRDWFLLIIILLVQFDSASFYDILVELCVFWWVFVVVGLLSKHEKVSGILGVFYPNNIVHWLAFLLVAFCSNYLVFSFEISWIGWALCSIIFMVYVICFASKFSGEIFSRLELSVIIVIFSFVISLYFDGIFALKNYENHKFKSPNYVSEQIVQNLIHGGYDNVFVVAKKKYNYEVALVYSGINEVGIIEMADVVILEKNDNCADLLFDYESISEFRFLNRVLEIQEVKLDQNRYFGGFYNVEGILDLNNVVNDYEIYVRKK